MVSRNNQWQHLQASARRVPHYGLRKLSVGVASVLLSTTLYMGVSAHADTVVTPGETTTTASTVITPNSGAAGTTGQATGSGVNAKPNLGASETAGQTTGSSVNVKPNSGASEMTGNAAGSGANGTLATPVSEVPTGQVAPDNTGVTPERAADGATDSKAGIETPTQPATSVSSMSESALPKKLVATAVKPAVNAKGTETTKLATFTWTIHYVDENGNKLAPDTVISHDYQRTDTNGTMGDYKYIDGSLKVTGTHNTGYHIDAPDFKYNVPVGKTSFDIASWNVAALSFTGYRPDYGSVVLSDQLTKDPLSLGSTSHDYSGGEFTFHYTLNPKTVTINYVNDDDNEKVVGTGTVSGKPNTEVTITPSLPSGYMLTPGKDVPSKYTVTDGDNQAVTIHVQKQFIDVSDTDSQAKQTRTITLHYVYSGGSKDGEKAFDDAVLDVYYHRTATLDRATNQTTYGDWLWDRSQGDTSTPGYHVVSGNWTNLPQSWATVTADVPSIKGYHADLGQNDPANTNHVPANTWVFPTYNNAAGGGISTAGKGATAYLDGYGYEVSPTHTIKYVPNKTTVTVNYVDDDNNKSIVGSQHWGGTIGQHINLTLTPPANYVLTPGWVNPTSYDFDGVNSSWYTVHVKHKTQDVTDQEPKDQVTKVTRLTRNHLYGDGPHKGEKFAEPDIFDLAWKRTATKDLVTGKVNFGDWQVDRDNSKSVQGSLHLYPDNRVGDGLHSRQNGYSYMGQNSHGEFVASDGTIAPDYNTVYGWSPAEAQKYSTVNYYYGPEQVKIPVVYVDADTGQEVASKTGDDALTGDDFRDGNTVTIDQSKLTSLPTTLTGYQLLPGQTLPTSYKIDTVAGVKAINVQVVKDRSVKVTFVDDDNKGVVVGTPTIITGHTGGDPVALDLTVPDKYELADGQQLPTSYTFTKGSGDLIIHLVHQERSVTVRFIDDRFVQFTDGHYLARQVGQAITLTGRAGDTVDLNLTVPDKYQLADGQQLPTSYTFTKGSGDLTIHLVHKIAQREAIIDVRLGLLTEVHVDNNSDDIDVIPKTKWTPQLADELKTADIDDFDYKLRLSSSVEAGTLTGHVNYDLVDEKVVSFGDDWTTLNLNGQTYQMPNGTDVVNGVILDYNNYTSKNFREGILKFYPNLDPDYANRVWHGYLSVNATNNNDLIDGVQQFGLQAGLVGDDPNALAKTTGDRAATSVEMGNKTIDLSLLQGINLETVDFSEQNGQLRADEFLPVGGVYIPYVEKTATRTIKITTPDGKTTTVEQTATLAKQVDLKKDAHQNWTTGEWASYDAPTIPGYMASQPNVAQQTVTGETEDQTVNITYTANPQTTTVVYQTEDGTPVHTTTVDGKTGQTVKVPNEVPAGWHIVNGKVPSELTFGPDGAPKTVVTIDHSHVTVTPDTPKTPADKLPDNPDKAYPAGVSENDLNKTVTRTIKVTTPDGQTKTIAQTAKLTRTADVDEVTGEVTYGKWLPGEWDAYEVPTVDGYTATQTSVAATPVDEHTADQMVEVSYSPNKQTITVKYVDDKGQTIHTTTVDGATDQTVKVPSEVPAGWMVTKGKVPSEITFGADGHEPIEVTVAHQHVTVTSDHPQTNGTKLPDNPVKTFNGVEANDLNKTITRTIKVTTPDGQTKTVSQAAKLTRTADVDEVTGEVTYSKWTTGQWAAYEVPALNGYTVSQTSVEATSVDENTKDQTVEVSYMPNKQTTTIKYVDDKGDVVHTTTVNGVTNQTVKVPSEVPAGWTITKGKVPSEITFGVDGHEPVVITVAHQHVTVDPDHPQNNGTKLPDNPAKAFNGVEANDLNKTITRTIKVTTPDGKVTTTKQTAKLTRTADVDEVTGEVTYGKWTTGQWNAYEVPALNGYTASQNEVPATEVTSNTTDQMIDVYYTANSQTTHINYIDDAGKIVHTTTVTGKTDQTVKVPNEVPAGWMITKGEVPSEISFGPNGHADETITIGHQHVTVDPDHPQNNGTKLPDNPAKTFNGVEANDLNKIITRTIKVTTPDGQTKTVAQTVKLTRTADVDEVTGEVTYGKWTTGEWAVYDAPSVAGYTPSQTTVAKESVTSASKDTTVEITYSPMQHQISVEYVDDDDNGKIVKTDQVSGKTDQTITVTPSAPANYDLVDNGNRIYTVTSDGSQAVQIHVKHHQVTTSESKTVTRTINVHTPHDGTKVVKQNAELTRDVTTDQVTGNKTYGDWTTGQWKAYTPEAIPGYTPSTNEVPNSNVDGDSKNQMVDVTYTADAQKVEIVYVDDTKGGAVVKTDQVAGKTDETVKVTSDVPAGYELVGKVPSDYTMTADGHQTITVHLVHQMKTASESKTVTRTINVHTPHDGVKTIKQTAELTRNVTTDQVTDNKTYGDWSTTEWDRYAVPAVAGYVPSIEQVAQQVVNGTTADQTIDVTYSSGEHTAHINYVDGAGNIVHTTTITGRTDGTVQVPNETPAGWTVVGEPVPTKLVFGPDGHADVTVTVTHQHVTVTPDQPKTPTDKLPDNPAKTYPNGVGYDDLNKTVTRTIKVTTPDGQIKTVEQTAKLTRTADVDEVTGEVTYGAWSTGSWDAYQVPVVPGYMSSQSEVSATKVTDDTKDQTVTVTYTANDQTTHINYVDGNGKTVHTTTITGQTDQTVKVPNEVPAGWTITDGQVPSEVTFGANGHSDVTVTVDHQHVTVTPDRPQTDGTKLPGNPSQTFHGVAEADLNKVVTRTIEVAAPARKTTTVKQTAKLTRTADVDEVTGEVTYGAWSAGNWDVYQVPVVPGYMPSQSEVPAEKVTDTTKDQTVTVTYTANDQVTHVNYVDGNGKIVHTTTVTGKTDQTVKVPNEVPTGWKITSGQVPSEITFGVDGHAPIAVAVVHQHVTVTPDQPRENGTKLPDNDQLTFNGVGENDLNKVVTRTIEVTTPAGKTDTITQTVKLTRTADVDEVTGKVAYGTWSTGNWDAYQVPALKGYTASQTTVAATPVTSDTSSQTVKITYTADQGTVYVTYVDEAGHSIHTTTVTGTTGQTVKVPKEVPAGWVITKGDVPTTVTVNGDETQTITITVQHRTVTVKPNQPQSNGTPLPDNPSQHFTGVESGDLNKTITRTIIFNVPGQDPRTITQTAKLTRTATVDEVTGEVTYGDWTTAQWPVVTVPAVNGYTTSQTQIPAVIVGPTTDNQTVTVDYRAVEVPTTPTTTPAARPMVTSHTSGAKSMATPATQTKLASSAAKAPAAKASQLPQTGSDETASAVMTSLGLLMGALSAFALGRKKKNKGRKA